MSWYMPTTRLQRAHLSSSISESSRVNEVPSPTRAMLTRAPIPRMRGIRHIAPKCQRMVHQQPRNHTAIFCVLHGTIKYLPLLLPSRSPQPSSLEPTDLLTILVYQRALLSVLFFILSQEATLSLYHTIARAMIVHQQVLPHN